jgi:hypothetical protein
MERCFGTRDQLEKAVEQRTANWQRLTGDCGGNLQRQRAEEESHRAHDKLEERGAHCGAGETNRQLKREIVERQRVEEELLKRPESIGILAGGIAHDFTIFLQRFKEIFLSQASLKPGQSFCWGKRKKRLRARLNPTIAYFLERWRAGEGLTHRA